MAAQTTENRILMRMRGAGGAKAFTPKDFLDLASYEATKKGLLRLANAGTIRRPLRGVYDYPSYSQVRKGAASPNPHAIAWAIARANGWTLTPTGESALNLLGLSTQVPARWRYLSNGPTKTYTWEGGSVQLQHCANKDISGLSPKTALIVQALKTLGGDHVDERVLKTLRSALTARERARALRETRYATAWVHEIINRMATLEDSPNA